MVALERADWRGAELLSREAVASAENVGRHSATQRFRRWPRARARMALVETGSSVAVWVSRIRGTGEGQKTVFGCQDYDITDDDW